MEHPKVHRLSVEGEEFLNWIKQGVKIYEGRIDGSKCKTMIPGDKLELFEKSAGWGIECSILALYRYRNFQDMLTDCGILNMLPQMNRYPEKTRLDEGVKIYRSFPGAEREALYGVVAIEVRYTKDI